MLRRTFRQVGVLVFLALLPGIGQAVYLRDRVAWDAKARSADEIKVEEAIALGDQVIWVDARPDHEFAQEHVPGAIQLNEDRWDELFPQMLATWSPEKRVIIYCGKEACGTSREVLRRLRTEAPEMKNAIVLSGGWDAWRNAKK